MSWLREWSAVLNTIGLGVFLAVVPGAALVLAAAWVWRRVRRP